MTRYDAVFNSNSWMISIFCNLLFCLKNFSLHAAVFILYCYCIVILLYCYSLLRPHRNQGRRPKPKTAGNHKQLFSRSSSRHDAKRIYCAAVSFIPNHHPLSPAAFRNNSGNECQSNCWPNGVSRTNNLSPYIGTLKHLLLVMSDNAAFFPISKMLLPL